MGNKLPANVQTGTFGVLLVQLRLLEFGVQAAAPLEDSGNDLIAVKGEAFRGIQVKTRTQGKAKAEGLPMHWHILALVNLKLGEENLLLDSSEVCLISRGEYDCGGRIPEDLTPFRISEARIGQLFSAENTRLNLAVQSTRANSASFRTAASSTTHRSTRLRRAVR